MAKRGRSRKNTKKEEFKPVQTNPTQVLFITLGVAVFLLIFYFLTLYITSKNQEDTGEDNSSTPVEENISSNSTIVGRSLSMGDAEYLVLFYDKKDEDNSSTYSSAASNYRYNSEALPLYEVDMSSAFNKNYVTDGESNKNPTTEEEILINGPTLIRVQNGQVVEYLEGESAITSYLN